MIDNYDALTIGRYIALDKSFDRGSEDIDNQVAALEVLTDYTREELETMPMLKYKALSARLAFLYAQPEPAERILKEYRLGGLTLLPCAGVWDMTAAQYTDFQAMLDADDIVGQLSCLLLPKGRLYCRGYRMEDVRTAIEALPVPDALALRRFFFLSLNRLIDASLTSCWLEARHLPRAQRREVRRRIREIRRIHSAASGGGSTSPAE